VIHSTHPDPYRALIEATESQVALVMIGGDPLYGDEELLAKMRMGGDYEHIQDSPREGSPKAIVVKNPGVPKGTESYAEIVTLIRKAAKLDAALLADTLNGTRTGKKSPRSDNIKAAVANLYRKENRAVPANLTTPGAFITTVQVRKYLGSKYPGVGEDADPIYQQDDRRWFERVERNIYARAPNKTWDPAPLREYVR
jgi:hypothetical protein